MQLFRAQAVDTELRNSLFRLPQSGGELNLSYKFTFRP